MTTIIDGRGSKFVTMDVSVVLANIAARQAASDIKAVSNNTTQNYFFGPAGTLSGDRTSLTLVGTANLATGLNAMANIRNGGTNTAYGRSALSALQDTGGNCAFGDGALQAGASVTDCTAMGHKALTNCTTGVGACAFGKNSQEFSQVATSNSSFGDSSMGDNTLGIENSAFGYQALRRNTTGDRNAAFGQAACFSGTNSDRRCGFGYGALEFSTGNGGVGVGYQAGGAHLSGDSCVFIGDGAGTSGSQKTDATNSIAIGAGSFTDKNNQVVIGNTSVTETVLRGVQRGTVFTVAGLPSASTMGAGARAFVSNATVTTFATVVAGGGTNNVPVYSDGTNWRIG